VKIFEYELDRKVELSDRLLWEIAPIGEWDSHTPALILWHGGPAGVKNHSSWRDAGKVGWWLLVGTNQKNHLEMPSVRVRGLMWGLANLPLQAADGLAPLPSWRDHNPGWKIAQIERFIQAVRLAPDCEEPPWWILDAQPAPDALLAHHLLRLLPDDPIALRQRAGLAAEAEAEARVIAAAVTQRAGLAAKAEAKVIAAAKTTAAPNLANSTAVRDFLVEHA